MVQQDYDGWVGWSIPTLRSVGVTSSSVADDNLGGVRLADPMIVMEHSDVIGQAKGILMGKLGVGANEALDMLTRAARAAGRPVYEFAAELLARRPTRPGIEG